MGEKIGLYHGTLYSRAEKINVSGKIVTDAPSPLTFGAGLDTEKGFIYLTTNPAYAVYFGNLYAVHCNEEKFCVYEVIIKKSE